MCQVRHASVPRSSDFVRRGECASGHRPLALPLLFWNSTRTYLLIRMSSRDDMASCCSRGPFLYLVMSAGRRSGRRATTGRRGMPSAFAAVVCEASLFL